MEELVLNSQVRECVGRRATKRLRGEGFLPVNIYGHKQANLHAAVEYRAFEKFIRAGHRIVTVEVGDKTEHGVVKEVQYDSLGTTMIHADITRVDLHERITLSVPVVTVGVSKGQSSGGTLDIALKELNVEGPASSLPEIFEIQIADLEVDQSVRVRDLEVPEGCRFVHEDDDVILAIHATKLLDDDVDAAADTSEPEVISKQQDGESEDAKKG